MRNPTDWEISHSRRHFPQQKPPRTHRSDFGRGVPVAIGVEVLGARGGALLPLLVLHPLGMLLPYSLLPSEEPALQDADLQLLGQVSWVDVGRENDMGLPTLPSYYTFLKRPSTFASL